MVKDGPVSLLYATVYQVADNSRGEDLVACVYYLLYLIIVVSFDNYLLHFVFSLSKL